MGFCNYFLLVIRKITGNVAKTEHDERRKKNVKRKEKKEKKMGKREDKGEEGNSKYKR